jgi:hypothetical protein
LCRFYVPFIEQPEARSHRILNGPKSSIDLLQAYVAGDAN